MFSFFPHLSCALQTIYAKNKPRKLKKTTVVIHYVEVTCKEDLNSGLWHPVERRSLSLR